MTVSADWGRVKQLFQEALDTAPDARVAFVKARAENALIFQEVISLLQVYPAATGFLSTPPDSAQVRTVLSRLEPGDELGPFQIISLIGVGGMGEVYRARDTRLDRQVAIKVLPPLSSVDGAGRERFEAEARAISRLTHPRINTLYDVGAAPVGSTIVPYLVMELVEGETLAARLKRGPVPVRQALAIAVELAEALAAAHAAGVIHRDVKPANIMLTRSGAKLLDFGLARLRSSLGVGHAAGAAGDPATPTGLFGTLPYMAPELLRGAGADARTDLFAFGATLYEMLEGRPAFAAGSEADLVVAIHEHEPAPVSTHQPLIPAPLERLITTCLAKDPDDRWQTAQDLVRALRWVRDDHARPAGPPQTTGIVSRKAVVWGAGGAALLGLLLATAIWQRPAVTVSRVTFPVFAPPGTQFPRGTAQIAIAPDGTGLVFVAVAANGTSQLWMRRFDTADSTLLVGTDDGHNPFWSPDGRWIGFFTRGKLMKVSRTGGEPQVLSDAGPNGRGTWNQDGTILFSGFGEGLQRVSENGGSVHPVTVLDDSRKESAHSFPVFLPDGHRFLYLAVTRGTDSSEELFQGSLDSTATRRVLASEANVGVAGRYLISLNKGVLVAQPYDPDRAAVTGVPIEIADRIQSDSPQRSGGPFSVGAGSVIAYRSANPNSRLLWFDRAGRQLDSFPTTGDYHHPRLSPDERSLIVEKTDPSSGRHTIWILDLLRRTSSRLIADPFGAHHAAWSPDGHRIVFSSNRLGGLALFMTRSDGSGTAEPVLPDEKSWVYIADWSRDGRYLLYQTERGNNDDLDVLPLDADRKPRTFVGSAAKERQGQFSPDGRWIAYTSDESGSPEVYVRHFPDVGKKWQISTHGGVQGRWRGDAKELFYLALDGTLMAVDVKASSSSFEAGAPLPLFNTGISGAFFDRFNQYLVTRDGRRVLVNRSADDESSAPITVVMNWDAMLRH
jgi:Tol biopolymer transport system component